MVLRCGNLTHINSERNINVTKKNYFFLSSSDNYNVLFCFSNLHRLVNRGIRPIVKSVNAVKTAKWSALQNLVLRVLR